MESNKASGQLAAQPGSNYISSTATLPRKEIDPDLGTLSNSNPARVPSFPLQVEHPVGKIWLLSCLTLLRAPGRGHRVTVGED